MPVTVITGASRGIGQYLAGYYRERGHTVVPLSRREGTDVADDARVRLAFAGLSKIDNLINCAGIASMNHSLTMPADTARRILETNILGTFLTSREAARVMLRQKYGRIVNFSSVAVPLKLEGEAIYAASKAGVEMLTQVLAREYGPLGITVNAVGPNPIETDLIRGIPKQKIDALIGRQAVQRFGTMEDVASAVDFFIDPKNSAVTGQVVYLGGV